MPPAGPALSGIEPRSPGTREGRQPSLTEGFTHDRLRELHRALLMPRIIEEKMLLLLRQGRLSKWFSGIGQEAIAVGVTSALAPDDWILPMHRNLGVFTTRGVDLGRLLRQLFGKEGGFTKGRDRTFHFGTLEHRIVGMISHLGATMPVADGLALAALLRGERRVAASFTGEGGTSEGDFHEAVNLAAVWKLPVLFVIENNAYGLSTPVAEQYACENLADRGIGYGIPGVVVDGNDLLAVHGAVAQAAARARAGEGPTLLEFKTFRMRGHEEASGTSYIPRYLFEEWARKDPIVNFEKLLVEGGVLAAAEAEAVRAEIKGRIDALVEEALAAPDPTSTAERELADVYAPGSAGAGLHAWAGEPPGMARESPWVVRPRTGAPPRIARARRFGWRRPGGYTRMNEVLAPDSELDPYDHEDDDIVGELVIREGHLDALDARVPADAAYMQYLVGGQLVDPGTIELVLSAEPDVSGRGSARAEGGSAPAGGGSGRVMEERAMPGEPAGFIRGDSAGSAAGESAGFVLGEPAGFMQGESAGFMPGESPGLEAETKGAAGARYVAGAALPERRYVDAISEGLRAAMRRNPRVVLLGQDIAEYGGVFKVTQGFLEEFGRERVRNTPIIESGALGAALGLAIDGFVPMVEMQFGDFITCGFNQVVNHLAKTHYRWGAGVPVVVRCPVGGGVGAGPFHSQNIEAWFTHVAGLKVVAPATPRDAKGLLLAAFEDGNPVLYLEHKFLYRSARGPVPEDDYAVPIGLARLARGGRDATIVTYGVGVTWALEAAAKMAEGGREIEVIDLRTLLPWDTEAVLASVRKTSRVLVLHEAPVTGGFCGEVAAVLARDAFEWLDAPVMRLGSLDTPVPFNRSLEEVFSPKSRLPRALEELLGY